MLNDFQCRFQRVFFFCFSFFVSLRIEFQFAYYFSFTNFVGPAKNFGPCIRTRCDRPIASIYRPNALSFDNWISVQITCWRSTRYSIQFSSEIWLITGCNGWKWLHRMHGCRWLRRICMARVHGAHWTRPATKKKPKNNPPASQISPLNESSQNYQQKATVHRSRQMNVCQQMSVVRQ